jgi:hypothetical protein
MKLELELGLEMQLDPELDLELNIELMDLIEMVPMDWESMK